MRWRKSVGPRMRRNPQAGTMTFSIVTEPSNSTPSPHEQSSLASPLRGHHAPDTRITPVHDGERLFERVCCRHCPQRQASKTASDHHAPALTPRTPSECGVLDRAWAVGTPHLRCSGRRRHPHGAGQWPSVSPAPRPVKTRPSTIQASSASPLTSSRLERIQCTSPCAVRSPGPGGLWSVVSRLVAG